MRVPVRVGSASYEAIVGSALLAETGKFLGGLVRGRKCAVIADENTAPCFAAPVQQSLRGAGFQPSLITIPPGENSKSVAQLGAVCEQMAAAGLDRTSFVVALGGGVVGDLAGFAAAVFHRGISCVQIPTTLLAQVDSAIGGKTGVNLPAGKNLLGAVHQPVLVLADTDTLRTLPARELNQGFAEITKHAVIAEPSLFEMLEEVAQVSNLRDSDATSSNLAPLIARNIEIKAGIVAADEHDTSGERAILNFGHTIGHAIEQAAGFGRVLHGEAVSLGMVAACEVSVRKAGLPEADRHKIVRTLQSFNLPTELPRDLSREQILEAVRRDKKNEGGEMRFVVTPALGSARLTRDVTVQDIARAIEKL